VVCLVKPKISMRILILWILLLSLLSGLPTPKAQATHLDTFFVEMNPEQLPFFKHSVQKGENLYQLSKKYNVELDKLHQWNAQLLINQISLGTEIIIPLEKDKISTKGSMVLLYKIMPKDNLFSIAKRNLGLELDFVRNLNQMEGDHLPVGQNLILGYLDKNGTAVLEDPAGQYAKPNTQIVDSLVQASDLKLYQDFQKQAESGRLVEERGIAFWKKESGIDKGNYVLHRDAPLHSIIEITNPMFNKTVYAKVVGKMPPNTYSHEVKIVITPGLAKELGAIDPRFFTYIKYLLP
jgi:hypothetical protein